MSKMKALTKLAGLRTIRAVRRKISVYPKLYLPIRRARKPDTIVRIDTDLLIEGFPRSGNTWTEALIRYSSSDKLKLAHHSHAAAHVIHASRLGVPTVVLFRAPDDAIKSYLTLVDNSIDPRDAYLDYIVFYRTLISLDIRKVLFLNFENITKNWADALKLLNQEFALDLDIGSASKEEATQTIYEKMDAKSALLGREGGKSVSRPGLASDNSPVQRKLASIAIEQSNVQTLRVQARTLYDELCNVKSLPAREEMP